MKYPLKYRVYEGFNMDGEKFLFSVSNVREITLREEIAAGEKLIKIGKMLYETENRNKARNMTEEYNGYVAEF